MYSVRLYEAIKGGESLRRTKKFISQKLIKKIVAIYGGGRKWKIAPYVYSREDGSIFFWDKRKETALIIRQIAEDNFAANADLSVAITDSHGNTVERHYYKIKEMEVEECF